MNARVKQVRKELNLTMELFGGRLGVTRTAISNIENGNRKVTEQMVKSICREFNVNEGWLRTGKGGMFKKLALEEEVGYFVEELLDYDENPLYDLIIDMMQAYQGLDGKSQAIVKRYFKKIRDGRGMGKPKASPSAPDTCK